MGVAGSERRKGWWFEGVGCNGGCVGALGAREWVCVCVCVRVCGKALRRYVER